MAFGDTTQSAQNSAVGNTVTVTISAATAGNLLIACAARSVNVASWTDPGGIFAAISDSGTTGNMAGKWYYGIAAGGETSVVLTGGAAGDTIRGVVAEIEGPFDASPLDVSAEDQANVATVVTSQSTGTTGTTAQNDEVAIAFFGGDTAQLIDGGKAYSNSFSEVIFASSVSSTARAGIAVAKKVLTSTGTVECTYSDTDTGDEMYGAVATFKKQSAAATKRHTLAMLGVG